CDATPGPVVSPDHGELLHTEACVSRSKRHSWDAFRDSHRKAKLSWPSSTHVGKGTLGAPDWSPKPLPRPSRAAEGRQIIFVTWLLGEAERVAFPRTTP